MEDWLANICGILRASELPQIYGDLVRYKTDYNEGEDGDVVGEYHTFEGKCALGVISCEVGMTLDYDHQLHDYIDILDRALVPRELSIDGILPYIDAQQSSLDGDEGRYITECDFIFYNEDNDVQPSANFAEYIFKMNDGGLTFSEIADYLEETFGDYNNVGERIQ